MIQRATHIEYFQTAVAMGLMFGQKVDLPTVKNAKEWMDRIENELSPENLSCDGELRGRALMTKRARLLDAAKYIQTLLPAVKHVDQFSVGMGFSNAYRHAIRTRTADRMHKLDAAVSNGFVVGARILISNGTTGTIVKINRTRVKVKGDDHRMWSVPPRCMTLVKS